MQKLFISSSSASHFKYLNDSEARNSMGLHDPPRRVPLHSPIRRKKRSNNPKKITKKSPKKMKNPSPLIVFLLSLLATAAVAEIKDFKITDDSRPLILLENFAFSSDGAANIAVHDASVSSSPAVDHSLLGFFIVSSSNLKTLAIPSQNPNPSSSCVLSSRYIRLFTFRDLSPPHFNSYNRTFPIAISDDDDLYFANCIPGSKVSMSIRSVLYNLFPDGSRDFLPVGRAPVPTICCLFSLIYVAFFIIWVHFGLIRNRSSAHPIHYLMAGLLFAKALNLVFKAEDQHYVRITGTPHGWDVLFYMFQFIKGVLLFTVIVLIGTGWSFLKPFLQDREKQVLMLVIPLQVITNIASIVIGETGPFIKNWTTWVLVFVFVDIVCCCAVLFPIFWSIRSLRENSKTDGKAARNLAKLVLFRRFYLLVIGYLYSTRGFVVLLKAILSYKYQWVCLVVEEGVSLAFYVVMFWMFRPKVKNEYLALDDEEEAVAMAVLREEDEDV